jgi:hypothetical protein
VRAHDLGVQVNVWTVNDAEQLEQLRDADVDAVITDDTGLYRLGERGGGERGGGERGGGERGGGDLRGR